jgi:hypothetical protein
MSQPSGGKADQLTVDDKPTLNFHNVTSFGEPSPLIFSRPRGIPSTPPTIDAPESAACSGEFGGQGHLQDRLVAAGWDSLA